MDQINEFMATMPGWLAAIITAIVAIIVAYVVKMAISTVINKTRFGAKAKTTGGNLGSANSAPDKANLIREVVQKDALDSGVIRCGFVDRHTRQSDCIDDDGPLV